MDLRLLLFLLALSFLPLASAHPANVPSAQIKVSPDGTYSARIRFDALAFATDATPRDADDRSMNALLDGPDDALAAALADGAGRFRRGFAALDGGTIDRLEFPTVASTRRFLAGNPSPRLPVMLTALVWGHLPKGSRTVAFRYPDTFDTIIQTVEIPYQEPASEPVDPGHVSSTLRIPTSAEIAKTAASFSAPHEVPPKPTSPTPPVSVASKAIPTVSSEKPPVVAPVVPSVPKAGPSAKPPAPLVATAPPAITPPSVEKVTVQPPEPTVNPMGAQVATYLRMGFHHILPEGLDHILFVLGLFLLGSNTKALLKQITAFTVAHSITLALATLDIVRLPSRIIEPVIALSIAFVAIENLFTKDVKRWRTAVVFLFGLVHGMGFAEVFKDAGLSGKGLIAALLSFNVGVELGQLSVVAMALLAVGWFRKDPRYRSAVVVPASLLIALVALFWTAQRTLGIGV